MSIKEIINGSEHRPWSIPKEKWRFYQEWNNAILMHWQVELNNLKQFVPKDLEIDLYNGKPWISLVAFTMQGLRTRNLPSFPPISNFDEINIRTYIRANNKTGVYFLSIEGGAKLSCMLAKAISQLPYRHSKMKRAEGTYLSKNSKNNERLKLSFSIGEELLEKDKLDLWLTERYALFQDNDNSINEYEIHHLEWPLKNIGINNLEIGYSRFNKLLNNSPSRSHYSEGVKVIAWRKKKLASYGTIK